MLERYDVGEGQDTQKKKTLKKKEKKKTEEAQSINSTLITLILCILYKKH